MPRVFRPPLAVLSSLVALACHAPAPSAPPAAPAPLAPAYTLVQLKTGPVTRLDEAASKQVFGGHFANMQRLAREGALLLAGPYGKAKSDAALRGLFVLATADRAEAKAWADSDPACQAGVFRCEFAALATPADLRAQVAADLAREDAQKASGVPRKPGEGMRGYVLLTAAHGAAATPAFAGHPAALLVGQLEGGRALVLLDAKDLAAAEAILAPLRPRLGEVALDEWYATDLLVDLPKRGR
jgi:uncharacterized protein YciI